MALNNQCFIVDVDDTLVSREAVRQWLEESFSLASGGRITEAIYAQAYEDVKSERDGQVIYEEVAKKLAQEGNLDEKQALEVFLNAPFEKFVLPSAYSLLEDLKRLGKVIILSEGEPQEGSCQRKKIEKSGLLSLAGPENVIVHPHKIEYLKEFIPKLRREGRTDIYLIDDRAAVLDEALKFDPDIRCIWMKYGRLKDRQPFNLERMHLVVDSLQEIRNHFSSNLVLERERI